MVESGRAGTFRKEGARRKSGSTLSHQISVRRVASAEQLDQGRRRRAVEQHADELQQQDHHDG